jgi:hypothetical protein
MRRKETERVKIHQQANAGNIDWALAIDFDACQTSGELKR